MAYLPLTATPSGDADPDEHNRRLIEAAVGSMSRIAEEGPQRLDV
jgi:hypothetical protein